MLAAAATAEARSRPGGGGTPTAALASAASSHGYGATDRLVGTNIETPRPKWSPTSRFIVMLTLESKPHCDAVLESGASIAISTAASAAAASEGCVSSVSAVRREEGDGVAVVEAADVGDTSVK